MRGRIEEAISEAREQRPPDHADVAGGLASRVLVDHEHRVVVKRYQPPPAVRALYWLAFQAPFPYATNESALEAARHRRTIAGILTEFWFGRHCVSPVLEARCDKEGCVFVTQLIEGVRPRDTKHARRLLSQLAPRFRAVGLPTWQVSPFNPKAVDNLIETADGNYQVIDLESGIVSPLIPASEWWDAIKAGLFPVFDDVFVDKTRDYVDRHRDRIEHKIGPHQLERLEQAINDYERHASSWKRAEPRIWSRLVKRLFAR